MIKHYIFLLLVGITLGPLLFIIGLAPLIKNALLSFSGINTIGKVVNIKEEQCGFLKKIACPIYSVKFYTNDNKELEFTSTAPNKASYQLEEAVPVAYTAWLKKENALIKGDTSELKSALIIFIPGLLLVLATAYSLRGLIRMTPGKIKLSIQQLSESLYNATNKYYGLEPAYRGNNKVKNILWAIVSLLIAIFFLGGQFFIGYNGVAIAFGLLALYGVAYNLGFSNRLRINPALAGFLAGIIFLILFYGTFFYVFVIDPFIK